CQSMVDFSDDDIEDLSGEKLIGMPAGAFGSGNAAAIRDRVDRLLEDSLTEQNESVYVVPLYLNVRLQRDRDRDQRDLQRERETEKGDRKRLSREEQQDIERFQLEMDHIIESEKDLLAKVHDLDGRIEEMGRQLDARTVKINGHGVYRDGDHFVDENGN